LIIAFTIQEITNPATPWLKEIVWHTEFLKFYNILAWLRQEDMDSNIANLVSGYTLDTVNPITYNKYNGMGLIRFKALNA
jgi:hypothetical protein